MSNQDERIGRFLVVRRIVTTGTKTCKWLLHSNAGNELGMISWYGPWRQYTFDPIAGTTFNSQCLEDIAAFLNRSKNIRQS